MDIKVKKKDYNLHVFVTISPRHRDQDYHTCGTDDVLKWLSANKPEYKIVKVVSAPKRHLHNSSDRLSGEWVFELLNLEKNEESHSTVQTKKMLIKTKKKTKPKKSKNKEE